MNQMYFLGKVQKEKGQHDGGPTEIRQGAGWAHCFILKAEEPANKRQIDIKSAFKCQ